MLHCREYRPWDLGSRWLESAKNAHKKLTIENPSDYLVPEQQDRLLRSSNPKDFRYLFQLALITDTGKFGTTNQGSKTTPTAKLPKYSGTDRGWAATWQPKYIGANGSFLSRFVRYSVNAKVTSANHLSWVLFCCCIFYYHVMLRATVGLIKPWIQLHSLPAWASHHFIAQLSSQIAFAKVTCFIL